MTDDEAKEFFTRLAIAFPAIEAEVKFNSPDVAATHRTWATILEKYTLAECNAVLQKWLDGDPPDKTDLRFPAHAIRAVICRWRDKDAQRLAAESEARRRTRRVGSFEDGIREAMDGDMVECFRELRPLHKKLQDGLMTEQQYAERKKTVLARLDAA